MRNVLGLSTILLICVALGSCSGNKPEKAFMGTWESTAKERTLELSILDKGIWLLKPTDSAKLMNSGTWTIGPDGSAVMTHTDGEAFVTLMGDGRIAVRANDGVHMFERATKKK